MITSGTSWRIAGWRTVSPYTRSVDMVHDYRAPGPHADSVRIVTLMPTAVAGIAVFTMTNPDTTERTTGGLAGRLAGKVKAAAGQVLGNEDLAREGRLQEAQSDAEITARREEAEARQRQAEADLEAERNETEVERARLQAEVAQKDREEQ